MKFVSNCLVKELAVVSYVLIFYMFVKHVLATFFSKSMNQFLSIVFSSVKSSGYNSQEKVFFLESFRLERYYFVKNFL